MKKIILRGNIKLPKTTIKCIKCYYKIPEKDLMNGRETRKVLKLLEPIYDKRLLEREKIKVKK